MEIKTKKKISTAAQMGARGGAKPKNYTPEEIAKRTARLAEARKKKAAAAPKLWADGTRNL